MEKGTTPVGAATEMRQRRMAMFLSTLARSSMSPPYGIPGVASIIQDPNSGRQAEGMGKVTRLSSLSSFFNNSGAIKARRGERVSTSPNARTGGISTRWYSICSGKGDFEGEKLRGKGP